METPNVTEPYPELPPHWRPLVLQSLDTLAEAIPLSCESLHLPYAEATRLVADVRSSMAREILGGLWGVDPAEGLRPPGPGDPLPLVVTAVPRDGWLEIMRRSVPPAAEVIESTPDDMIAVAFVDEDNWMLTLYAKLDTHELVVPPGSCSGKA